MMRDGGESLSIESGCALDPIICFDELYSIRDSVQILHSFVLCPVDMRLYIYSMSLALRRDRLRVLALNRVSYGDRRIVGRDDVGESRDIGSVDKGDVLG